MYLMLNLGVFTRRKINYTVTIMMPYAEKYKKRNPIEPLNSISRIILSSFGSRA